MPAQTIELPVATIRHLDQQVRRHSPRYFREVAAAGEYLYAKLIDAGKITEKEAGKEIAIDLSSGCFGIGATSSEALAHLDSPIQNRHIYFRTVTASREKSSA